MAGRRELGRQRRIRDTPSPRIDWAVLGGHLVERLGREADAIRDARPPVRVRPAEMERRLGRHGWLRKRFAKLPLANREMTTLTEHLAAFRVRRIEWIATRELRSGSPAVSWKVMRAAGLASCHMPTVEAVIAAMACPANALTRLSTKEFPLSRLKSRNWALIYCEQSLLS